MSDVRRPTPTTTARGESPRRFALGHRYATPAALAAVEASAKWTGHHPAAVLRQLFDRHAAGDWGDVDAEDHAANERALATGARVLSAYVLPNGERLWVLTEAADDDGARHTSTALLPDDY